MERETVGERERENEGERRGEEGRARAGRELDARSSEPTSSLASSCGQAPSLTKSHRRTYAPRKQRGQAPRKKKGHARAHTNSTMWKLGGGERGDERVLERNGGSSERDMSDSKTTQKQNRSIERGSEGSQKLGRSWGKLQSEGRVLEWTIQCACLREPVKMLARTPHACSKPDAGGSEITG
eukprot:6200703-Pleurochrysis_carterae.AAC.3